MGINYEPHFTHSKRSRFRWCHPRLSYFAKKAWPAIPFFCYAGHRKKTPPIIIALLWPQLLYSVIQEFQLYTLARGQAVEIGPGTLQTYYHILRALRRAQLRGICFTQKIPHPIRCIPQRCPHQNELYQERWVRRHYQLLAVDVLPSSSWDSENISLLTRRLVLDQSDKAWVGNAVACIHNRVFGGCLRQQRGLEQDVIRFARGLLRLEQTSSLMRLTIFHCLWSSVWNQLHRNSPRYIHGHACTLHKRRQKHCFGSV